MDPTRGWHDGGFPLMVLGAGKGVLGLALRPACGALQFLAKGALGAGLVCLGREAISGSTLRRMRAPAALNDDSAEARPRGRPGRRVVVCVGRPSRAAARAAPTRPSSGARSQQDSGKLEMASGAWLARASYWALLRVGYGHAALKAEWRYARVTAGGRPRAAPS
jgi:hypothetical protein